MQYNYTTTAIPCGMALRHMQPGYTLSNGVVLLHSERDSDGNYYGAVGMDGIYLRTGKRYHPILDAHQNILSFQEIRS